MISIKGLHKKYGKVEVIKGLDLDIDTKGIFAILGPNGSGKTTLIKSILGMVIPEKGEIFYEGRSVLGEWEYRRTINYMPQIANFPANLKVSELINMIKDLRNQDSNEEELIAYFGLEPFLKKQFNTLSGGTKQKVNLLLTFMFDNPLLVLDEPTTGLDPVALIRLKDLISKEKEKGKTILLTTHIMGLVEEIADEIVFLLEGKIYFKGKPSELKTKENTDNLERAIASIISSETNN